MHGLCTRRWRVGFYDIVVGDRQGSDRMRRTKKRFQNLIFMDASYDGISNRYDVSVNKQHLGYDERDGKSLQFW